MKKFFAFITVFCLQIFYSQSVTQNLDKAIQSLLVSSPMYSGNLSFYVADESGSFVYEFQGNKGLSTASTMKIFTAAAALETLGKNYQYKTQIAFDKNLYIFSNGDPTLGSWRYDGYKPEHFISKIIETLKYRNIKEIPGEPFLR